MNDYAIYRGDVWLENVHAGSEAEALELAISQHGHDVRVELESENHRESNH